ncbi:hypothetical protein MTO96_034589 [Rhipicephalus appendiculatus]
MGSQPSHCGVSSVRMAYMQASRVSLCWRSTPAIQLRWTSAAWRSAPTRCTANSGDKPTQQRQAEERTEPPRVLAVTTSPPLSSAALQHQEDVRGDNQGSDFQLTRGPKRYGLSRARMIPVISIN